MKHDEVIATCTELADDGTWAKVQIVIKGRRDVVIVAHPRKLRWIARNILDGLKKSRGSADIYHRIGVAYCEMETFKQRLMADGGKR